MSATHDSTRQTPQHEQTDEQIRAVAETYELEDAEVTMIKDPENPHAWIQSNATVTLLR